MILKTLTHDHGESDVWNYYDNVESASVYYDEKIEEAVVSVRFKNTDADIVIVITEVAYLCNDEGKTIEKLRPAIKEAKDKITIPVEVECELKIKE